jgi:L-lactate dehydrogenase complex protein LldG
MTNAKPNTATGPRTTRQQFMARIHAALEHTSTTPPAEPAPAVDESLARLARPSDDLLPLFEKRATEVGMKVQRIASAELTKRIAGILQEIAAKRVVVSVGSVSSALGLKESIRRKNIEVVDWQATPGFECQFDTDAGITDVHAAFAETGTMVCCSDAGHSRGLSLVPPVHIAIVRKSDILPDMIDFWAVFKDIPGPAMPSSIAFITGPSKTADIEGVLITGVHGPGTVYVLTVEDE